MIPFQDDARGVALWLVRMAMVYGGGYLTSRGIVDPSDLATISGAAEALVGAAVTLVGVFFSWRARQAALRQAPRL